MDALSPRPLRVRLLGRQPYEPVWRAMQRLTDTRDADTADELWVLEHDPVFTLGQAGKWEHVISPEVEAALARVLGEPTTCPHGNPIPGTAYQAPATVALSDLGVGAGFTVMRIPEELEFTPGLLEFLEDASIQPGHTGTVTASSPDGTTTVEIDGRHVGVGSFASARILVADA